MLHHEDEIQLAVFYGKLYHSQWVKQNDLNLEIKGDNFDVVWDNIVAQIALVKTDTDPVPSDLPVAEQLAMQEERTRIEKEIAQLEKQARKENQPKRKFEIVGEVGELKRKLNDIQPLKTNTELLKCKTT